MAVARAVKGWAGSTRRSSSGSTGLIAIAWAVILPYALYALRSLTPEALIERAERFAVEDLDARRGAARTPALLARARQRVLDLGT